MTLTKDKIASFPYFNVFADADLEWFLQSLVQQSFLPGDTLIAEGEENENIYLLLAGVLQIYVSSQTGDRQARELSKLEDPGEMMGEMSFLDNSLPSATIKASSNSQVLLLSKQVLSGKLTRDRDFASRFNRMLAIKLSHQLQGLSDLLTDRQIVASPPLRKVLLAFNILKDIDIDWMCVNGVVENISPGTMLISAGKPIASLYILLEGVLSIYIKPRDSAEREVGTSKQGEILGEISFVEDGPATATVKAKNRCRVLGLPRSKLNAKLTSDSGFAERFYQAIAIVLSNRWRDRLRQRGLSYISQSREQLLDSDMAEDEIDLDVLEDTALGGVRFDWMLRRLKIIS